MILRTKRRLIAVAVTLSLMFAMGLLHQFWFDLFSDLSSRWQQWRWVSGWGLLALIIVLALLNLRKKLSFLPLGRAYIWVQIHVYGGLLCILMFGLHANWSWPEGWVGSILTTLFWLTTATGVIGLLLSRALPKMMNARSERIFMSRLAGEKAILARDAANEVASCVEAGGSARLLKFYQQKILPYLRSTQDIGLHLMAARTPYRRWNAMAATEGQFMNDTDRDSMARLIDMVHKKIDLDFQHVMQLVLKGWLFIHIPISFGLLLTTLLHVVLVYSFIGG